MMRLAVPFKKSCIVTTTARKVVLFCNQYKLKDLYWLEKRGDKCMLTKEDIKYMEKMGLDLDFNKPLSKGNYEQLEDILSHQLQVYGLDKK